MWESTKRKLDWKEDEERGQEYLQEIEKEEVAEKRAKYEEENASESEEEEEDDMEVPDELLAEFCNESEEQGTQQEDGEPSQTKRNMMKIPNFILMVLKNNTGDQEAADLGTGRQIRGFNYYI